MDYKIARFIYSAQYASDYAKGIRILDSNYALNCDNIRMYTGYYYKDIYIMKAIKEICKSKGNTNFSFYVCHCKEKNVAPYLVYFNALLHGKRCQVSFHSFDSRLDKYISKRNIHATKWDKKIPREACKSIIKYYYE